MNGRSQVGQVFVGRLLFFTPCMTASILRCVLFDSLAKACRGMDSHISVGEGGPSERNSDGLFVANAD